MQPKLRSEVVCDLDEQIDGAMSVDRIEKSTLRMIVKTEASRMKIMMVLCLSSAVLVGCKKTPNEISTGPRPQRAVVPASSSQVTPSVASAQTALPAKVSEQQSPGRSNAPRKEPTLAEVLATAGLKPAAEAVKDLDHPITSYAALSDPDAYLIAYYWNLPPGRLEDPLRVLNFSRQTEEWKSAQLMLGGEQIGHSECVGSVLHAHALPTVFLFDTHINPSAGCLLILDRNLAFRNALYGWYLAAVGDTQIVFQRSEVHFAPVHPTELALYDLKTNRETSLFPRKPFQRVRAEYTAKLGEFYRTHQEWCKENNDPCDAESVDSTLDGEVAISVAQHALAFVISYDRIQDSAGPVQKPEGPGKVVYVCRYVNDEAKLDYREMLVTDVEKRFGKLSLPSLLEPAALREVFANSSTN
jgi:hypothetical protein